MNNNLNISNSYKIKVIATLIIGVIFTVILFQLFGNNIETQTRNYYRKNICNCDTNRVIIEINQKGVPIHNYHSITGKYIGIQLNPSTIAMYAEKYFNENNKLSFFNCLHTIDSIKEIRDSSYFFPYKFDWNYNMKAPWYSAMAQGNILKTYTMAFEWTKDSLYLIKAQHILNSFQINVSNKGVTYFISDTTRWFEEYAHINGKNPMVLNGMMYALSGIHYYYKTTKKKQAEQLFSMGMNGLIQYLPQFDDPISSKYDINGKVASDYYHQIHILLLNELYQITANPLLKYYLTKWSNYTPDSFWAKTINYPNKTILVSLIICWISISSIIFFLIHLLQLKK